MFSLLRIEHCIDHILDKRPIMVRELFLATECNGIGLLRAEKVIGRDRERFRETANIVKRRLAAISLKMSYCGRLEPDKSG